MKKILYRKFLSDCLIFFLIALISTSIIIWVFQAVNYLDIIIEDGHEDPTEIEYYMCGPPMMIDACDKMLYDLGVERDMIAYDSFG